MSEQSDKEALRIRENSSRSAQARTRESRDDAPGCELLPSENKTPLHDGGEARQRYEIRE